MGAVPQPSDSLAFIAVLAVSCFFLAKKSSTSKRSANGFGKIQEQMKCSLSRWPEHGSHGSRQEKRVKGWLVAGVRMQ